MQMATFVLVFGFSAAGASNCGPGTRQIAATVCMPHASDGDIMKHTPDINDTLSTERWLASGGRGVDSAWSYDHGGYGRSQRQMGIAIKASAIPRNSVFITSKIPCGTSQEAVLQLIQYDLDQFMVAQLDLLLIHQAKSPFCNTSAQIALTWAAMQTAAHLNLTRAIGVSNFVGADLERLKAAAGTTMVPAVNQIKLHVGLTDLPTIAYCKQHNITIEAYSPLGGKEGKVWNIPEVVAVAKTHNKSTAQVALKWIVQSGHCFVTSSGTVQYDTEDLDLESWQLSSAEMDALDAAR